MIRRDPRSQDGWVLVTAITLMAVMLSLGLVAFTVVDTGTKRSREQRERESSLSLAEAALYAQGFALRANDQWPTAGKNKITQDCTSTGPPQTFCPDDASLAKQSSSTANFTTTDFKSGASWVTKVRDNGGPLASTYDPAQADAAQGACPGPCREDFNGDRQLWVQARAVVRGKPRNIVALLKLERLLESVPSAGVTAGGIDVSNNGNQQMVDATGSSILLRCDTTQQSCANYGSNQVTPVPTTSTATPPLMTPAQIQRFKDRAITDGAYYNGCAAVPSDLSGAVVFVDNCFDSGILDKAYATCNPAPPGGMSDRCINQITSPGILIWHCGRMDWRGNETFVGLLYAANNSDGTCIPNTPPYSGACFVGNQNNDNPADVVKVNGGFGVWGALAIDGGGCLQVGSNGMQVKYDASAFGAVESYGTVGLVQNTWRELKPN
jgi:Tfp pilus assembly protein PilX